MHETDKTITKELVNNMPQYTDWGYELKDIVADKPFLALDKDCFPSLFTLIYYGNNVNQIKSLLEQELNDDERIVPKDTLKKAIKKAIDNISRFLNYSLEQKFTDKYTYAKDYIENIDTLSVFTDFNYVNATDVSLPVEDLELESVSSLTSESQSSSIDDTLNSFIAKFHLQNYVANNIDAVANSTCTLLKEHYNLQAVLDTNNKQMDRGYDEFNADSASSSTTTSKNNQEQQEKLYQAIQNAIYERPSKLNNQLQTLYDQRSKLVSEIQASENEFVSYKQQQKNIIGKFDVMLSDIANEMEQVQAQLGELSGLEIVCQPNNIFNIEYAKVASLADGYTYSERTDNQFYELNLPLRDGMHIVSRADQADLLNDNYKGFSFNPSKTRAFTTPDSSAKQQLECLLFNHGTDIVKYNQSKELKKKDGAALASNSPNANSDTIPSKQSLYKQAEELYNQIPSAERHQFYALNLPKDSRQAPQFQHFVEQVTNYNLFLKSAAFNKIPEQRQIYQGDLDILQNNYKDLEKHRQHALAAIKINKKKNNNNVFVKPIVDKEKQLSAVNAQIDQLLLSESKAMQNIQPQIIDYVAMREPIKNDFDGVDIRQCIQNLQLHLASFTTGPHAGLDTIIKGNYQRLAQCHIVDIYKDMLSAVFGADAKNSKEVKEFIYNTIQSDNALMSIRSVIKDCIREELSKSRVIDFGLDLGGTSKVGKLADKIILARDPAAALSNLKVLIKNQGGNLNAVVKSFENYSYNNMYQDTSANNWKQVLLKNHPSGTKNQDVLNASSKLIEKAKIRAEKAQQHVKNVSNNMQSSDLVQRTRSTKRNK